jgi:choloylglycine hydrolase
VKRAAIGAGAAVSILGAVQSYACTRVLWNAGGPAILVGRTMDWPESTEPILTVLPRGLKHDGGKLGGQS